MGFNSAFKGLRIDMMAEFFINETIILLLWLMNYPDLRKNILYVLQSRESENILHNNFSNSFSFQILLYVIKVINKYQGHKSID